MKNIPLRLKDLRSRRAARSWSVLIAVGCMVAALIVMPRSGTAQLGAFDRDSAKAMLQMVKDDLKKNYYDPSLRGLDLEARFKQAEDKIKQAQTRDQLVIPIAQLMLDLNDSHTFFLPPFRAARVRYGWRMQMIGDTCFVTHVNPKSDAAAKGLIAGDKVLTVDGNRPTRENLWKINYRYYSLIPSRSVKLSVIHPDSEAPREIEVLSKIEKTAERADYFTNIWRYNSETLVDEDRFYEQDDLLIWEMPGFDVSPEHIDEIMSRVRKHKALVLDLRGNGGGYKVTLERFAGYFFDRDIKVADVQGRTEMKPILAKTRPDKVYKGQLIVLIDSRSASAAELFARVVQIEKRGTVLGDRSAGAVMLSRSYDHETGVGGTLYFGASVTIANVMMSDGKGLERSGVVPDELVLPSALDIANRRDPVLARAAAIAGVELSADKAGTLFPVEWWK